MTTKDLGPRPFAIALGILLAVYASGRCSGKQAADLGWHERNVATLAKHVRTQRTALASAIAAKDTTTRNVADASGAVDDAQAATEDQLLTAEAAIQDSAATIHTLRARLGEVVAAVRLQQILTDSLQAAIVRDASAHLAERAANKSVIAAQDAVIQAQKRQIKALTPTLFRRIVQTTCTAGLAAGGAALGTLVPAPAAPIIGATLGVGLSAMVCQ